ncbi:hypothetical protein BD770DRAFT_323373, partial [Pilaira anomala]
ESEPLLQKHDVVVLLPKSPIEDTQVQQDIKKIITLFKEKDELQMIGKTSLSPYLKSMADTTTNRL